MSTESAEAESQPSEVGRPFHLLTTDMLLTDLVSGRSITTGDGTLFAMPSTQARAVLNWYRSNRPKWAGNVMTPDCEAIVVAAGNAPPVLAAPAMSVAAGRRILRLTKIVAHRFAGLHAYGVADQAPDDFVFEPDKPVTLFEGWNGSGKTSLANAIIWCLTGQVLRPQRLPENGDEEFACQIERQAAETSAHQISPVTPLPSSGMWMPEADTKVIPADTWVELTFVDEAGNGLPPIRRTQTRKPNGKLVEMAPDAAALGVEPIAFRLGTTMPGMLPFLQVGSASELGRAVAQLTGLADLVDLAKHAGKAKTRISGQIRGQREEELGQIEARYVQERCDLEQRIAEFPAMTPAAALPHAGDANAATEVATLRTHFEKLKADGLASAREVLGESFDPEVAEQRKNLEDCVVPATEQLKRLKLLPGIDRLSKLRLEDREKISANELLSTVREEARILADLAADSKLARRAQLYARVAGWMAEHGHVADGHCAVCRHALGDTVDPDTGIAVANHLSQAVKDSEVLSKSITQWAAHWSGTLARDLPLALKGEIDRDLPTSPAELLRASLTQDLFETEPFSGVLAALKPGVEELVFKALAGVPTFIEPSVPELPTVIAEKAASLVTTIERVERARAFIEWMAEHRTALLAALDAVRSGEKGIDGQLERLDFIVKGVAPITAAIGLTSRMARSLTARTAKLASISACDVAVDALASILPIGALADAQVEGLRQTLHDRAEHWRNQIYQNATTFSPKPHSTTMSPQGVIELQVGRSGVHAPAQHVSNASALRAGLMGFYLAFREHVLKTSGGLALLVLDDPQDLLDYDNRQRLARAINRLAGDGAQIIATTHDRSFARTLVAEARADDRIAHRSVHPVNASRRTLSTSLAIEELDRKRNAFVANVDSGQHAQDYANEARIFLESRLGDLFDDPAYPAYSTSSKAPTLIPQFDRLKGLVAGRSNELFKSPVLGRFCADPAMADKAEARRVLNQSHHDKASLSYPEVAAVDEDLRRLRASVERVHEEFRRFRWREPLAAEAPSNVVMLKPIQAPKFSIPICQDIAAFTGHVPIGGSQDESGELLLNSWFDDKALFYVRHDTMGFAIPAGSVAIVEAESSSARDHCLVIARRGAQIYARRLLRPRNGEGYLLSAEATDPRQSRPTLAFEDHGIDVHRVVGALFSHLPPPPGRQEAAEIESDPALSRVEVAYRVREESAVPRALPGQIILGGPVIKPAALDAMEGMMVALTLEDGASILKRVGARVSSAMPHLRQFETIGGLGDSVVIAVEHVDGESDVPVMLFAREVIGVLYDR